MPELMEQAKEIVPSSYYDLIARVVPGSLAIVVVYWLFSQPPMHLESINATTLVLLVGAGYVLGGWLSTISTLLLLPLLIIPKLYKYSDRAVWEAIRRRAPDTDGSTVIKMAAESTAAENFFLLAILLNIAAPRFAPQRLPLLLPLLPVTLLIAVIRRYMLRIRLDEPVGQPVAIDDRPHVEARAVSLSDAALLRLKTELARLTASTITVEHLREALDSALAEDHRTHTARGQASRAYLSEHEST